MKSYKTTWKELAQHNISASDLILFNDLNRYGFDDKILGDMDTYEIAPQCFFVAGAHYVLKQEIQTTLNRFLRTSLELYKAVELCEQREAEYIKQINEGKFKISPEDYAKWQAGEITLEEIKAKQDTSTQVTEDESVTETE